MYYACAGLCLKIIQPLFSYWYMKSQSEKYVHTKP